MENETIKKLKEIKPYEWWIDSDDVEKILTTKNAIPNIKLFLKDSSASNHLKFLVAEILFSNDKTFPNQNEAHTVAKIYSQELKEAKIGNCWGVPGSESGWSSGPIKNFAKIAKNAIPELKSLLSDERVLMYIGSEEATVGNGFHIRVKDVAAYLLASCLGVEFKTNPKYREQPNDEWKVRDKQIEKIKLQLKSL